MTEDQKVSEMILDVASAYIEQGKTIEEMQFYLDITCASWNMAILPKREKDKKVKKFIKSFKKNSVDPQFVKWLNEDVLGLIKAKNDLFPNISYPIENAKIEYKSEAEYKVTAAFLRKK
tara:strand:+ start:548 stop:904 length:357 start_codon:yes stop_codon:yes gene_type:complete